MIKVFRGTAYYPKGAWWWYDGNSYIFAGKEE